MWAPLHHFLSFGRRGSFFSKDHASVLPIYMRELHKCQTWKELLSSFFFLLLLFFSMSSQLWLERRHGWIDGPANLSVSTSLILMHMRLCIYTLYFCIFALFVFSDCVMVLFLSLFLRRVFQPPVFRPDSVVHRSPYGRPSFGPNALARHLSETKLYRYLTESIEIIRPLLHVWPTKSRRHSHEFDGERRTIRQVVKERQRFGFVGQVCL